MVNRQLELTFLNDGTGSRRTGRLSHNGRKKAPDRLRNLGFTVRISGRHRQQLPRERPARRQVRAGGESATSTAGGGASYSRAKPRPVAALVGRCRNYWLGLCSKVK